MWVGCRDRSDEETRSTTVLPSNIKDKDRFLAETSKYSIKGVCMCVCARVYLCVCVCVCVCVCALCVLIACVHWSLCLVDFFIQLHHTIFLLLTKSTHTEANVVKNVTGELYAYCAHTHTHLNLTHICLKV